MFSVIYHELDKRAKKWKLLNWLVRRRRPLWCQWRPLCGFGNFENKLKILDFFPEIWKVLKTMKNFEKLWVIISKVRSKFWRWEGYIVSKFCTIWYRNEDYVNNLIICVFPVEISDCRTLSLSRLTFFRMATGSPATLTGRWGNPRWKLQKILFNYLMWGRITLLMCWW